MRRLSPKESLFRLSVVSACLIVSSSVYASAFQIWEQSAYGTGDYHAGAAAEADDASLEFYNPAQITELKHQQISMGGVLIPVNIKFNGTVDGVNANGKSDNINVIPNFHYVAPINKRLFFAFGVTTPFGLQTNYGTENAIMAVAATKTQLLTVNSNPSLAYKITDWMSVGAGFDVLRGLAAYNNAPSPQTPFKNKLDGWGVGYNAGVFFKFRMFNLPYKTRIGVSYRSKITIDASGKSHFQGNTTDVKAKFPLPATTLFSIYQQVNDRLALMGSVFYTQWDIFTLLELKDTAASAGGTNIPVYEAYNDTWNVALGAHVKITKKFTWKVGGGWDETPTRTGYRDVRLPDANRFALSTGFHWQAFKKLGVDVGYTHIFAPKAHVSNAQSATGSGDVIADQEGTATMDANIFGGQMSWSFD
jgi:long-chain fatty acid transport protein